MFAVSHLMIKIIIRMKEEYLHFVFKNKFFGNQFKSSKEKKLEIIDFGEHNVNAGPDFLDAKIRYDNKVWAGAIEFHVRSSDWYRHKHQNDPAYNAVIAHFVYENDMQVKIGAFDIPTVELKEVVDLNHFNNYQSLALNRKRTIPCAEHLPNVNDKLMDAQKHEMIQQRLWRKSVEIISLIEQFKGDRKKAFYMLLAKVFGGKVNALPLTMLVNDFDLSWLAKLNYDPLKVEALLLGKGGFLNQPDINPHIIRLQEEYAFLKHKFSLIEMEKTVWKYSRMYPSSFPEIRIAQFAHLLTFPLNLTNFLNQPYSKELMNNWKGLQMNDFWEAHFRIGKQVKTKSYKLSDDFLMLVFINVIVPFKYAIGVWEGNTFYKNGAIDDLTKIQPEKNSIIKEWNKLGVSINSACDSQSLLEQKKERCNRKKCLFCAIGQSILKR